MKLLVNFSKGRNNAPIIAQVVKETGVLISVERAVIDSSEGEALIEVPDDQCKLVRASLTRHGATVRLLEHGISLDTGECVDCGACISICPREVFSFDTDWKLTIAEDRCILCGTCVPACPHQALTLPL